jgi:hypothetical protein
MGRTYRAAVVVVTLLFGATLAGCSSSDAEPAAAEKPRPSMSPPVTGSVEQVAARLDCKPSIRTDADELRQGICETAGGEFSVTTFPEEKFKLIWLDAAAGWGGWYVVGPKWAVSANTKNEAANRQKKLGGTLVDGSIIPKSSAPAAP